jgi:hypothetical protein
MDETTQAVFDVMNGDSVLVGLLSQFDGEPSIFTMKEVPPDAARPYIWSYADITNAPFESKTDRGRDVTRDIWVVADDVGDEDLVMEIANRVQLIFHRVVMSIGIGNMRTIASGPRVGESGDDITARIVTVSFVYQQS